MPTPEDQQAAFPNCVCGHDNMQHPRELTDAEPAYRCVADGCECAGWEEIDHG